MLLTYWLTLYFSHSLAGRLRSCLDRCRDATLSGKEEEGGKESALIEVVELGEKLCVAFAGNTTEEVRRRRRRRGFDEAVSWAWLELGNANQRRRSSAPLRQHFANARRDCSARINGRLNQLGFTSRGEEEEEAAAVSADTMQLLSDEQFRSEWISCVSGDGSLIRESNPGEEEGSITGCVGESDGNPGKQRHRSAEPPRQSFNPGSAWTESGMLSADRKKGLFRSCRESPPPPPHSSPPIFAKSGEIYDLPLWRTFLAAHHAGRAAGMSKIMVPGLRKSRSESHATYVA